MERARLRFYGDVVMRNAAMSQEGGGVLGVVLSGVEGDEHVAEERFHEGLAGFLHDAPGEGVAPLVKNLA